MRKRITSSREEGNSIIIGRNIAIRRAELDLTQAALCRLTGASPRMMGFYERGITKISAVHLISIADALDTTIEELCKGAEHMQIEEKVLDILKPGRVLKLKGDRMGFVLDEHIIGKWGNYITKLADYSEDLTSLALEDYDVVTVFHATVLPDFLRDGEIDEDNEDNIVWKR